MRLPVLRALSPNLLSESGAAVLSALLLLLSFPPFNLNFLAWISLAPLLYVLVRGVRPRRAFWLGWLLGIEFTFFAENWIAHSMTVFGGMLTILAYLIALFFAAILALFPAAFSLIMARFVKQWGVRALALAPLVWTAIEWVRPYLTSVTWNAVGVSQFRYPAISRLAQYGGVYLISACVVAGNAVAVLLLKAIWEKNRALIRPAALLAILVVFSVLFSESNKMPAKPASRPVTVVGVQPNLPPDKTVSFVDLENNLRLSREGVAKAPEKRADLIIWAESPLLLFYESEEGVRAALDGLANETGSHLIVNSTAQVGGQYTNSVQVIPPKSADRPMKRYDKVRLVPFGEYVPFNAVLKYVVPRVISSESGGFARGTEAVVNTLRLETSRGFMISAEQEGTAIERTTDFIRVSSFICYEAAYPDLVRQFVRNGATMLVNVSNDAWFGNTAGAEQHLAHAIMRAIENNRPLVRVTNSGVSALITAEGTVIDRLPSFTAATQVWTAEPRRELTFYTRHGEWFAMACALLGLLALVLSFTRLGRGAGSGNTLTIPYAGITFFLTLLFFTVSTKLTYFPDAFFQNPIMGSN
jgi:apolipoprotein N-acyltransferase